MSGRQTAKRPVAACCGALDETQIAGVATTIPADVAIFTHADFAAGTHSTKWVEEVLDLSDLPADPIDTGPRRPGSSDEDVPRSNAMSRRKSTGGVSRSSSGSPTWAGGGARARSGPSAPHGLRRGAQDRATVAVPMQGTIVKVLVAVGDKVEVGQTICLLEAMKMENAVNAEKDGVIKEVRVGRR